MEKGYLDPGQTVEERVKEIAITHRRSLSVTAQESGTTLATTSTTA